MRFGVFGDVHGNLAALEAVLAAARCEGLDGWLCTGDLVGYGPWPNEVLDVVRGLGVTCVAGNHDLIAAGRLDDQRCSNLARSTLRWTREALSDASLSFLRSLPLTTAVAGGGLPVVIAHGSLSDPCAYVEDPPARNAQLHAARATYGESGLLLLGHTHHPIAYPISRWGLATLTRRTLALAHHGWSLINPGSVGQSRERSVHARWAIVDTQRLTVRLRSVSYDVERCRAHLRRSGLPEDACHRHQNVFTRLERRLGLRAPAALSAAA